MIHHTHNLLATTCLSVLIVLGGSLPLPAQNKKTGKKNSVLKVTKPKKPTRKLTPEEKLVRKLTATKNRLLLEQAIALLKLKKEMQKLYLEKERLALKNKLMLERNKELSLKMGHEQMKIKLRISKLKLKEAQRHALLNKLRTDIAIRQHEEKWKKAVNRNQSYTMNPFRQGILYISDRRIPMNGPIITGVADYVTRRIHYFNNKSSRYPIFIVIDRCPGGSVMEGYRIVKAMQASKAPVYVVVKSFAASMAAVITTLAKRSFAYPNAVILHHQMSTINWGNMTELREQLKMAEEWERRLHRPVAKKMGIAVQQFVKTMYSKNSRGDWEEFADNAVKLKWVDNIVKEIKETSVRKEPKDKPPKRFFFFLQAKEKRDPQGRRYIELPRLCPYDFYYIYNPDKYYR